MAGQGAVGSYPRLGVVAPNASACETALEALTPLGAARSYPTALDEVEALRPHLAGEVACAGAREFSARALTLPTHKGLRPRDIETMIRTLARLR